MKFKLLGGVAAAMLALSATGGATAQDAHETPILELAKDGLVLKDAESGEADTVGFGSDMDLVVESIGSALGEPTSSDLNSECGAGPLQIVSFQGDLRLFFKAGEFAGWEAGEESGFSSAKGVRIGMTSDELMAASEEMEGEDGSIGYEWQADGLSGLLTEGGPQGKITTIWAGTTCIFR